MSTSNDEESNRLRTSRCRSKAQPVAKRALVDHTYVDHKHDPIAPANGPVSHGRGGVTVAFPEKLHEMLNSMEEENLEHIVSWQPHGRCFQVHKKTEFIEMVMPRFFHQSKLTSFQRQLNLYGFVRLTTGRDRGGYYHELFLRGRPDLCSRMTRTRIKGNGMKAAANPQNEPNFYAMTTCSSDSEAAIISRYSSEDSLPTLTQHAGLSHSNVISPETPPRKVTLEESALEQAPNSIYMFEFPKGTLIPSGLSGVSSSIVSDDMGMLQTGDEAFFEGLKFRYLDHLDVDEPVETFAC